MRRIGRYNILGKLGEGGMGVVYRAHDREHDRRVALKVLNPALRADREGRARFLREAEAISRLRHPGIAALYEHGEVHLPEGSTLFIAMELVTGRDLSARMLQQEFDDPAVISIGRQLASALAAAHAEGVVHRDLKPANIVLDSAGQVKILDFGLAKLVGAAPAGRESPEHFETQIGMVVGTAPYSAPEQLSGGAADPRGDLFSLGVVLFQLRSGRVPFPGASTAEMLERVQRQAAPPLAELVTEVSPRLAAIVDRLLAARPEDRYSSGLEVDAELAALESPATPAPPEPAAAPSVAEAEPATAGSWRSALSSLLGRRRPDS